MINTHYFVRKSSPNIQIVHGTLHYTTLHEAKYLRRKLERRWQKNRLIVNHQIYRDQCVVVNKLIKQTRIAYYSEKITACTHDQKCICRVAKHLLGERGSPSLPQTASPSELTEMFSSFFMEKIQNIRRGLQTGQVHGVDQDVDASSVTTPLERFTRASDDEVKTLILNSPDKSCDLDPMPTWLLKLCADELLPIITAIGNASMDSSCVPRGFKCAQVRPLIKKPTLDPDILKHYRPMSNLPFIAKVLEEVVDTQI